MSLSKFVGPFGASTYRARRQKFLQAAQKIEDDFVCFFWSGYELIRSHDTHFQFRANSDFLYLTGFSEPETLLILSCKNGKFKTSLGLRPRDLSTNRGSEIWEGERLGVERAPKALGIDEAFDIHEAGKIVFETIHQSKAVFWNLGIFSDWDQKLLKAISKSTLKSRGVPRIKSLHDWRPILHEQRKVKSREEIELMRRAGTIASQGHIRAMATTRPGHYEYQVAAEVEREFKRLGAEYVAYNSIIAAGANACTLHYTANNQKLSKNDLLLIDAGAELHTYASDITRTFPVSGKFSKPQRAVYEVVLEAQLAAISACKPGVKITHPHEAAGRAISEGLKHLGFFRNKSVAAIYKQGLWKKYMPHGTSHWLGMDVHDLGTYQKGDAESGSAPLLDGSVITIEPGLYFRKDDSSVPPKYKGIGIRIEDDVHITRGGPDVLTAHCPKKVDDVEAACGPKL